MSKSGSSVAVARKTLLVLTAIIVSVAGLTLLAGGGYMLFANSENAKLPSTLTQVLAEENSQTATVPATTQVQSQAVTPTVQALAATETPTVRPTSTPIRIVVPTVTPTRIGRATNEPVPTATPIPNTGSLPNTGFGEFLQPVAGFALAGIALAAGTIRRHRK